MDRKTRRSLKKAQMAVAAVSDELEKTKMDLEEAKASISQLEANTEVLMTPQLPLPTPSAKNASTAF